MAGKISELTALTGAAANGADLIEAVDVSDITMAASGTNKRFTLSELISFLNANGVGGTPPAASETVAGIAEIATQLEVDFATDDTRIVTPLKMDAFVSNQLADVITGDNGATTLWKGTQAEYDAIGTKDGNTVYVVT